MSMAWKCACSKVFWQKEGTYNSDYDCAAKKFFYGLFPNRSVGGWANECKNYECSARAEVNGKYKCTCKEAEEWCNQCIVKDTVFDKCSYNDDDIQLCPFFRQRTAEDWKQLAVMGRVPFINSKGNVRPEARKAKKYFKISDAEFDELVKKYTAMWKGIRATPDNAQDNKKKS